MKAVLRHIRISPKKANLIAGMVRGTDVNEALNKLKFTRKKAANILHKLIESATANAETNFKQNRDKLYIKEIVVGKGPTYKRSVSVSRGRMHPIRKRTSNIYVTVDVKTNSLKPKQRPEAKKESEINTESASKEKSETKTKKNSEKDASGKKSQKETDKKSSKQ